MRLFSVFTVLLSAFTSSLRWTKQPSQHVLLHPQPFTTTSVRHHRRCTTLFSSSVTISGSATTHNVNDYSKNEPTTDFIVDSFENQSKRLSGTGKAKILWSLLKNGINPLLYTNTVDGLSVKAKKALEQTLNGSNLIPGYIISETSSDCGTRKLLIGLNDGQSIESVLIPSEKFDRTTLCVSTQIGCDRGCAFCLTGTMGLLRNLTATEIVAQVILAKGIALQRQMPPMTNVVFMGMGDAGRNMAAVGTAVECMTDRQRMEMAPAKITLSTVGPSPEAFMTLARMPGTLAWSLHSPDDKIRKFLVPSTRYSAVELREGLLKALASRPIIRSRTIMIALTLIDQVNDSTEDALKLAEFVQPMFEIAPKIALDLIPYNDNKLHGFKRPNRERVLAFQRVLREKGFFCSVRVTRGDEESAACGMLATERKKKQSTLNTTIPSPTATINNNDE